MPAPTSDPPAAQGAAALNRARIAIVLVAAAMFALGGGYLAYIWLAPPAADPAQVILTATLDDLGGTPQPLAQWAGKVMVVNFWATWCAPCREEIPFFIQLQERYRSQGLVFVGIAVDDKAKVKTFAAEMGINYPILIGELAAMELSRKAGNRLGGLPFTLIVDRRGKVVATELGVVKKLESAIQPLL
jgi:thiol-disulfide isomerase/thioredoxin